MKTSAILSRRAAAGAVAAAALVIGLSTVASAAPLDATTGGAVSTAVVRAVDPWSPEPVENELFTQTSQGWSGDVPVGTTTTTTMTITAKQDLVLRPENWYSGSEFFDFALGGRCPSSLFGSVRMAPGETCTVTWTMHPHDLVSLAAGWSFSATPVDADGAATGDAVLGEHNLMYYATVFSAEDVDFGEVVVGSSASKAVTFHNGSAVDAYLAVDAPWGDVTIPGRPVDTVLVPAGQELTVDAVYTPTRPGSLTSSSWYRTTLPGSEGRGTSIVRFSGSAVDGPTPPAVGPVDPTDPPSGPSDPSSDPSDPSMDPSDPTTDPTDVSTDPEGPLVDPTLPQGDQTGAGSTVATPSAPAASGEVTSAAPTSATGAGALASTGAPGLALALGALTLVCLGVAVRVWSRSRAVRDDARSALTRGTAARGRS